MARRDDGNEPIPTRPLRTPESAAREQQVFGQSPAPLGQTDLVPPGVCDLTDPLPDGQLPEISVPGVVAPPGAGNQYDWSSYPEICRFGIRPQQLNGIFMRFLQGHFARAANIYTPELREAAIWSPGADSRLLITTNTANDLQQVGKTPRIIIKRGRQESLRIGMGDTSNWDSRLLDRGTSTFSRFNQGTSMIYCAGETDGQAELLGQEVFQALTWAVPVITKRLPFHDLQVVGMGESTILSAVADKFAVTVDLKYAYEYSWRNTEQTPALAALQFLIQTGT